MTNHLDVDVLGLRVRIEYGDDLDAAQREQVRSAWSGAVSHGDGEPARSLTLRPGASFDAAMERLTVDVTLAALDELRGSSLMFHACGVADADGRVAAFVGPSGRGKTTLSRALGAHFGYVSDETVSVGPDLQVHPYRKPLSVVRASEPKQQVSPASAGLLPLPDAPLMLGALALLDRDADLPEPSFSTVRLVEALPQLVPQMSYLRDVERPLQAIAALGDEIGGFRMLRYPDASTVAPLVPELLDAPAAPSEWRAVPPAAETGPYDDRDVTNAILTDGFAVVMAGDVVHVLDGIAPTIWLAARDGRDFDGIVAEVQDAFGAPPEGDAADLVRAAIDQLVGTRVLGVRGDSA